MAGWREVRALGPGLLEYAPIIVFTLHGWADPELGWRFQLAAIMALAVLAGLAALRRRPDPVALGADLFLIVVAFESLLSTAVLSELLTIFQESALFVCVLLTVVGTQTATREGALGLSQMAGRNSAWLLAAAALLALIVSLATLGQGLLSLILPLAALYAFRQYLIARLIWPRPDEAPADAVGRLLASLENTIAGIAITAAWITLLALVGVRVYDIIARQFTTTPSGLFVVIEFRAFMLLVVLGLAYAYLKNAHVRVDILRARLHPRTQARLEIAGGLLVLLPLAAAIAGLYAPFIWESYLNGDRSWLFLGRPLKWLVKSMLPFGFSLLALAGLIVIVRNVRFLRGRGPGPAPDEA